MRISVCIACYNGERYIETQVRSILSQLTDEDEIIISDDGSTDQTIDIIKRINDNRIKVFINKREVYGKKIMPSCYAAKNFENALMHTSGQMIFLSDQDDVWKKNKVEILSKELQHYDCVISSFDIIDMNGAIINEYGIFRTVIAKNNLLNLIKMPFFGCSMAFNRNILNYVLPFPRELILHDNWIGFLVNYFGTISIVNEPLFSYRRHGNNATTAMSKSSSSIFFKIKYRLIFFLQIMLRIIKVK